MSTSNAGTERIYHVAVLGRTLEHLGVQMYKQRAVAIAELVANSWDACAKVVDIIAPEGDIYDCKSSTIEIFDDGIGMTPDDVEELYLKIGRNRRTGTVGPSCSRPTMGRKGIGKLAGFGIARMMTITTYSGDQCTQFTWDVAEMKRGAGVADQAEIRAIVRPRIDTDPPHGTRILLEDLKHKTALDLNALREALARRFSRTVRGSMKIQLNGTEIPEPNIALTLRCPEGGDLEEIISGTDRVSYYYGFAEKPISSKELRGFTIYVNGKTAQAPPFFFNVEATASGQHGTRYLTGEINADFIDLGVDDDSDVISTDRQEIDWDDENLQALREWGEKLARRALIEWAGRKGESFVQSVLQDEEIALRLKKLDDASRSTARKLLSALGKSDFDPDEALKLADGVLKAFEFRHFHDLVSQITSASDQPDKLLALIRSLNNWRVLESRAILEVISGRLAAIDTFGSFINNDIPETAPSKGSDSLHDLIAHFPWLLNPEWQVLYEERTITKQLKEWNEEDFDASLDPNGRYDFLALEGENRLVVIEIKRSGHAVNLKELQRLERYAEQLSRSRNSISMIMICNGAPNISPGTRENWNQLQDREILTWSDVYERVRNYYEHYRAVLEGDIESPQFGKKEQEVIRTRAVLEKGTYREQRPRTLGNQDLDAPDPLLKV